MLQQNTVFNIQKNNNFGGTGFLCRLNCYNKSWAAAKIYSSQPINIAILLKEVHQLGHGEIVIHCVVKNIEVYLRVFNLF